MGLKLDLLRDGYLPENLPPTFHTEAIASHFEKNPPTGYYCDLIAPVRPALYSASKRGLTRRPFSVLHPGTAYDLAQFVETNELHLTRHFAKSTYSLSTPRHTPDGVRAVDIASHGELEAERLQRLSGFRFIAKTDISRFFHSIYTHAVPWAFHGKAAAKLDRRNASPDVFFNKLDHILRHGQDLQTVGIPVGPDASRYIAEVIAVAIDVLFNDKHAGSDVAVLRHVDDVWIGAHSHADAEHALWRYREALREFELDINESKTRIYAEEFSYTDAWPMDVGSRLEQAIDAGDKLRSALEYAFAKAVESNDDGVLKFAIRQLDRAHLKPAQWSAVQPFLMRCAVHFGHTVDYVVRFLVWRKQVHDDLDEKRWFPILTGVLDRQARLGNDSEVCWLLFAALRLKIPISPDTAQKIVANCGALSIVAALHSPVSAPFAEAAFARLQQDTDNGPLWPLKLEWVTHQLNGHAALEASPLVDELASAKVSIFDSQRLTKVFVGVERPQSAIERRVSFYDHDPDPVPDEDNEDF